MTQTDHRTYDIWIRLPNGQVARRSQHHHKGLKALVVTTRLYHRMLAAFPKGSEVVGHDNAKRRPMLMPVV
jgi:hypothetical protein